MAGGLHCMGAKAESVASLDAQGLFHQEIAPIVDGNGYGFIWWLSG